MSETEKPDLDPNTTIQLDVLDDVELTDSSVSAEEVAPVAPAPARVSVQPSSGGRRRATFLVLLFAVLAVAIAAGLSVGGRIRERRSAGPGSAGEGPSAANQAQQSPSGKTLIVPTVEIR